MLSAAWDEGMEPWWGVVLCPCYPLSHGVWGANEDLSP